MWPLTCNQLLVTGLISCELTNANMCLEDHADIIGSISNSQSDRVLLGGFDQLHNLGNERQNVTGIHFSASIETVPIVPELSAVVPFDSIAQHCNSDRFQGKSLCSFLSLSPLGKASSLLRGWLHQ